jgi:1,4-alpha-glucan branching enzyme
LLDGWRRFESMHEISPDKIRELEEIELRDSVFPDLDPELWATTEAVLHHARR